MHIADQALELDFQIDLAEERISYLILTILNGVEVTYDSSSEENEFFDLNARLVELRIQRACLPAVAPRMPMRYACRGGLNAKFDRPS